MTTSLNSALQAGRVLEAWSRRDMEQLEAELDRTALFCRSSSALTAEESERQELLEAIAEQMHERMSAAALSGAEDEETELYRAMLRHLSSGEPRAACAQS